MRKLLHAEIPRVPLSEISSIPRHPFVVVLDQIRSVHNTGSIFRTSDAMLVDHLYLTGITATPDSHPEIQKTALGAQDTVPWTYAEDPTEVIQGLKARGYTICALEITDTPKSIEALSAADFPLCLIVGHEVYGVSDTLIALCDFALEIPQYGIKQSLNVSVAYGIAAYGIIQRIRQTQTTNTHSVHKSFE